MACRHLHLHLATHASTRLLGFTVGTRLHRRRPIKLSKKSQNSFDVFHRDRLLKLSFQTLPANGGFGSRIALTDVSAATSAQLAGWINRQMPIRRSHDSHHVPLRVLLLCADAGSHRHMLGPPGLGLLCLFHANSRTPLQAFKDSKGFKERRCSNVQRATRHRRRNRHGACAPSAPPAGPTPHRTPAHPWPTSCSCPSRQPCRRPPPRHPRPWR